MTKASKAFKTLEKKWNIPNKIVNKGLIKCSTNSGHFVIGKPQAIKKQLLDSISFVKNHLPTRSKYDRLNKKILLFDESNLVKYCNQLMEVNSHDIYVLNEDKRLIHTLNIIDIGQIIKDSNKK